MKNMNDFVEMARALVREAGFMSAAQLVSLLAECICLEDDVCRFDPDSPGAVGFSAIDVVEKIPCDDIKVVEYANAMTAGYRRKDLYYYSPTE